MASNLSDSPARRPTSRRYLAIAQEILASFATGVYRPGDRLPSDREIALQSGVSRPTAREALFALELLGVIEVRHGDGIYAVEKGLSFDSLDDLPVSVQPRELIEARGELEPIVARLAAGRVNDEHIARLEALLAQASELVDTPTSLPEFARLSLAFHSEVAEGSQNAYLKSAVVQLVAIEEHPLWILVNQLVTRTVEERRKQVAEHARILDAIKRGDAISAEAEMRSHLHLLSATAFPELDGPHIKHHQSESSE